MISRNLPRFALVALALGCGFLTAACQKVPLLAPSGSIITLLATTTALPVNGSTDIIAQVIEPSGTPPQRGTRVSFTTNLGSIQPSDAETDTSGKAVVKFFAGAGSGVATISAISGGVAVASANAVKIAVGTAAVGGITLSANPTSLSAAGGASTITAVVSDAGGNALAGVPVTFSTDNGTLGSSVVTTDTAGQAQTVLATSRTAKVTATAGVTTAGTGGAATSPTATVTVNVNAAATVSFGAPTPNPGQVGQPVSFTLTVTPATTGGGQIRQVVVDFGDRSSQALGPIQGATTLSHTYSSSGVFPLTATATDSNGDQFVGAGNVVVNPRPGLAVSISVSSANPRVNTPTTFNVSATPSTGNSITSLNVNFGDGQSVQLSGNATSVQHVYTTAGQFTVTATATDSNGATGSGSTVIVVAVGFVTADFQITPASATGTTATQFNFNASASFSTNGSITSYVWDFGDPASPQNTGNGVNINHTFASVGTHTVRLTVTDSNNNQATTTRVVTIN